MPPYLTQYFLGMTGSGLTTVMRWAVPYKDRDEIEASLLPVFFGNRRKRVGIKIMEAPSGRIWIQYLGWANQRFYVVPTYKKGVTPDGWKRQIIAYRDKVTLSEAVAKLIKKMKPTQQANVQISGGLMILFFEAPVTPQPREEQPKPTVVSKTKKVIRFKIKTVSLKPNHRR